MNRMSSRAERLFMDRAYIMTILDTDKGLSEAVSEIEKQSGMDKG